LGYLGQKIILIKIKEPILRVVFPVPNRKVKLPTLKRKKKKKKKRGEPTTSRSGLARSGIRKRRSASKKLEKGGCTCLGGGGK